MRQIDSARKRASQFTQALEPMNPGAGDILDYESVSREALRKLCRENGIVVLRLSIRRAKAAYRLLHMSEFFREPRRTDISKGRLILEVVRGLWTIAVVSICHPNLIEIAPFFILDKPHIWDSEECDNGMCHITFVDRK